MQGEGGGYEKPITGIVFTHDGRWHFDDSRPSHRADIFLDRYADGWSGLRLRRLPGSPTLSIYVETLAHSSGRRNAEVNRAADILLGEHGVRGAAVVVNTAGEPLSTAEIEWVLEQVTSTGELVDFLLQSFAKSDEGFEANYAAFVPELAKHVARDPARYGELDEAVTNAVNEIERKAKEAGQPLDTYARGTLGAKSFKFSGRGGGGGGGGGGFRGGGGGGFRGGYGGYGGFGTGLLYGGLLGAGLYSPYAYGAGLYGPYGPYYGGGYGGYGGYGGRPPVVVVQGGPQPLAPTAAVANRRPPPVAPAASRITGK